jgi:hypothetical protein
MLQSSEFNSWNVTPSLLKNVSFCVLPGIENKIL